MRRSTTALQCVLQLQQHYSCTVALCCSCFRSALDCNRAFRGLLNDLARGVLSGQSWHMLVQVTAQVSRTGSGAARVPLQQPQSLLYWTVCSVPVFDCTACLTPECAARGLVLIHESRAMPALVQRFDCNTAASLAWCDVVCTVPYASVRLACIVVDGYNSSQCFNRLLLPTTSRAYPCVPVLYRTDYAAHTGPWYPGRK